LQGAAVVETITELALLLRIFFIVPIQAKKFALFNAAGNYDMTAPHLIADRNSSKVTFNKLAQNDPIKNNRVGFSHGL
jgi:hypothetical protein